MNDTCRNCKFWQDAARRYASMPAECRRRAPVSVTLPRQGGFTERVFPVTDPNDWCGDYVYCGFMVEEMKP